MFSAFGLLVSIPIEITCSPVGLKICAISAEIKKYKSIIKGSVLGLSLLKIMKNDSMLSFHVKDSFSSWDFEFFVLIFG